MHHFLTFLFFGLLAKGFSTNSLSFNASYNQTVNGILGTAPSNANFEIADCDASSTTILKEAIVKARSEVLSAFEACGLPWVDDKGVSHGSEAYKAMFKSDKYVDHPIEDTFGRIANAQPPYQKEVVPSFHCVLPDGPDATDCRAKRSLRLLFQVDPTAHIIKVCPLAFTYPAAADYDRTQCPIVKQEGKDRNTFGRRRGKGDPFKVTTLSAELGQTLLSYYLYPGIPYGHSAYALQIWELNDAIKTSIDDSPKCWAPYQAYHKLVVYKCTEFPNIHLPPWNFLALEEAGITTSVLAPSPSNTSSSSALSSLSLEQSRPRPECIAGLNISCSAATIFEGSVDVETS